MSTSKYDFDHVPNKEELPDPQLTHKAEGASHVPIQKVGINHFDSPMEFIRPNGETIKLKGVFSGYCSLSPNKKGINMSRIALLINEVVSNNNVGVNVLTKATEEMLTRLESEDAYLKVKFDYPMKQESLRSKDADGNSLVGWVYYPCELEVSKQKTGEVKAYLTTKFIYSSACPCSYELAKHASSERGVDAISHSQRSIATTTIQFDPHRPYMVEDLVHHHRQGLMTESQVMVKREDEQAFAELNGSYPKFVEDATRLMYERLESDSNILDFVVSCVHEESLHPHNAVGVIRKGVPGGLR